MNRALQILTSMLGWFLLRWEAECTEYTAVYTLLSLTLVSFKVFHAFYKPLEYCVPDKSAEQCYIKVLKEFCLAFLKF